MPVFVSDLKAVILSDTCAPVVVTTAVSSDIIFFLDKKTQCIQLQATVQTTQATAQTTQATAAPDTPLVVTVTQPATTASPATTAAPIEPSQCSGHVDLMVVLDRSGSVTDDFEAQRGCARSFTFA